MLEQADLFQGVFLVVEVLIDLEKLTGVWNSFKLVACSKVQVCWNLINDGVISSFIRCLKLLLLCHNEEWREIPAIILLCKEFLMSHLVSFQKQFNFWQLRHVFDEQVPTEEIMLILRHLHH